MKSPEVAPTVKLTNISDICLIIKEVSEALMQAGADDDYIERFKTDALYDYKTVILTACEYVHVAD
ncbi:MAG: hypothetical protein HQK63_16980 [Desulfamplus sp.]|nr:hypothetical protein [Desulfamplus sp.]